MIDIEEFREHAHYLVDWMADYYKNIDRYPVKSQVCPGDILNKIPDQAPDTGESIKDIFKDFEEIIMPGITHWQNPKWFAYFQANSSYPSVLAEMLTATLGAQCMLWETSPAATELEEKLMLWLQKMMGLPEHLTGVIQDTASTATLCAILTAREQASNYTINKTGYQGNENFRIYCSTETHSSIDKAVKIAGMGGANLIKVAVDDRMALSSEELERTIQDDIKSNRNPLLVVATIGTTGTLAIDPLKKIAEICDKYKIWLHVDAAYAGSAMVLPEYRWMIEGLDLADSYVFNPHKWLFTNFDCSAYFVKDKEALIRTFAIMPEYLKTKVDEKVNNYRDWGIQLGRRFRALKLWFVIRNFGILEIQNRLRKHIKLVQDQYLILDKNPDFEIMVQSPLNMICFRFHPESLNDENSLNNLNKKILEEINRSGDTFLTHTKINGKYTIRLVAGQTYFEKEHLDSAWSLIRKTSYKVFENV